MSEFEILLEKYWDLAYSEGKTGESRGSEASEILHALRKYNQHPDKAIEQAKRETAEKCAEVLDEAWKRINSMETNMDDFDVETVKIDDVLEKIDDVLEILNNMRMK